ncbi:T9SS type A sorting domain-containing protein [Winogradskyella ursingii]|uniref:T9SS type A sorting domain-containing protein n=1 Tax=Winogradskyella ursingii TaxID=2686079 RepID=UPI0015C7FEAF|nr:T9SS type A sorting domain-containing protein [Winogradskyella ursingii]
MTVEQRVQFEYDMQKNPITGLIPLEEKEKELLSAIAAKNNVNSSRNFVSTYISRGPSNLGGRTRAFAIDISDNTGNTMLAGGVSSGMFRSTDGGSNWTKVSSNNEIHNVTAVAQDPRPGFQNIWYYGTGELLGNSASYGGPFYLGQGIWQSTDNGLTWNQLPGTNSVQESFDSDFDLINSLAVSPITGELFVAANRSLYRYDGINFNLELDNTTGGRESDVKITNTGRVYVAFPGGSTLAGVYTSPTGNGGFVNIANNGSPAGWTPTGRIVLGTAASNENIVYALYENGVNGGIEADLWRYNFTLDDWTDFSAKLPDEPGGNLSGNDPFAIQGGYDLEVTVKPDDENFVVIGGTNVYRINNINVDAEFNRIGGYVSNNSYGKYNLGGGDVHHPDIQDLVFSPFNPNLLYSGTDGGIHSADVTAGTVGWTNLNNNYQTYQYYHVNLDPQAGTDLVIGGAQDNGTTLGGPLAIGLSSNTEMLDFAGGDGVSVAVGRTGTGPTNFGDIQLYYGSQLGNIRTLRNGNQAFDIRPSTANNSIFVTYFYLDTETNTLYYADGNKIFRNLDAPTASNTNWSDINSLPTNEDIRSMAATRGTYNATTSFTLIGGDSGGVFIHKDPRGTDLSTARDITPADATTNSIVSGVAIHPSDPNIAMVVYSNYGINSIYITENVTSRNPVWNLVERNLESSSVRSAAIAEIDGDVGYFVGTARGLYRSDDPLTTDWEIEGADQIGLALVTSLVFRPEDEVLLVGTHGNGMYQGNFSTLSINEKSFDENTVKLYPNPAFETFTVSYSGDIQLKGASISDINGKIVKKYVLDSFNQSKQLDISQLVSGIYFVKLYDVKGSTSVKKLIVR